MNNNDISFQIDWNEVDNFDYKKSALKGSWITAFYKHGRKKIGVKCMVDFYKAIGINFEEVNPTVDGHKRKLRPHEIRCNPETSVAISDYIYSQYHPTKYKGRRPSAISFDLLNYMPFDDDTLPKDTIIIRIDNSIKWDAMVDY